VAHGASHGIRKQIKKQAPGGAKEMETSAPAAVLPGGEQIE